MRSLTVDEIEALERQGCSAEDWTRIGVAEDFCPAYIHNVAFYGDVSLGLFDKQVEVDEGFARHSGIRNAVLRDVSIGDNCLIENVGCHICRYSIGDECYISGVGLITCTEGASFGQCNVVSVLNEAGPGNVVIYDGLTSQMAAFMVHCSGDKALWEQFQAMVAAFVGRRTEGRGTIGYGVKIVNTREIVNSCIGDECEISGAERLCDCTLSGTPDASIYIGSGVECDNTVVQAGASVVGGARLSSCFVGEACHVGRGFSAESSLFFANSYVDNGEACAAFCGPFTVSHHKATLLIGCACSFFNAGSATNFSNHAYKLGPLHTGTLARGSKTGSGAHLLLPARIGAFSVCMGKIETHPDTRQLPFSYVIGSAGATYLVPGRNLPTVGTMRDVAKWPRRDMRPRVGRQAIVNFDGLSPAVVESAIEGRRLLQRLRDEQGDDAETYSFGGCLIRKRWLVRGIALYDMVVRIYLGRAVRGHYCELPESSVGTGEWADLAGMLVPMAEVEQLADDIRSGTVDELQLVDDRFISLNEAYDDFKWNFTYRLALDYYGLDTLSADDIDRITADYEAARAEWVAAVGRDAEREFALGDVDEGVLAAFLDSLEAQGVV